MKDLKKVEKLIINLGLSLREANVYTTLFRKKDFSASELQHLSGIPRTKVYEVLHQLINKGMCIEKKIGRYKKYEATNPVSVFDKLLNDLSVKENSLNNALKILLPIYKNREENDNPLDYIEVLKDKKSINERWLAFQKNAKKEILVFNKSPYALSLAENLNHELDILRNKVKGRGIYEYNEIMYSDENNIKIISSSIDGGEEARIVKELPMKMAIFDEKITMFALNDPISLKPDITSMIIIHPSFARALKCVFESIWEKAMPFEEFKINFEKSNSVREKMS